MTPLKRVISVYGREYIARATSVKSLPVISRWVREGVPTKHCKAIEDSTNDLVTAYELRPDIFPTPDQPSVGAI
ncbi:YdaS family helix-turn-helix protein [Candidatus Vondammii sp. HM_W22]|uniref:YdaS family helix-turn-helix protein n=1 Tax=Candidatus Vondammii sp. HM_W22 TaxID=2687299 RepID=UPI00403DDD13